MFGGERKGKKEKKIKKEQKGKGEVNFLVFGSCLREESIRGKDE